MTARLIRLVAAAIFACAGKVPAQTAGTFPEMVISATALPLTEAAINQHVQVFTRAQIEAHPASSLAAFLQREAGIPVDRRGRNGGFGSLFLRGADPSHVVVLIDGVRQNDPLSSRGSAVDLNTLSLDDIERIEVVRGNASVVHGEALAGVIQLFTRAPTPARAAEGRALAEAGGYGARAAAVSLQGGGWRASATHREDGDPDAGVVRNRSANLGWSGDVAGTSIRVDARLADAVSHAFPDDSGGPRYAVVRELARLESHNAQGAMQVRHALNNGSLLEARIALVDRQGRDDSPRVAPGLRDPAGLPRTQTDTAYGRTEVHAAWVHQGDGWEASAGVQAQHEHAKLDSLLFFGRAFPAAFSRSRNTDAIFGEFRRTFGSVSVHGGLRVEHTAGEGLFHHPALGVQYSLPNDTGRVGLALSSASKLPSFYALGHPIVGDPGLRPERTRQFETYYAAERGAAQLRATLFYARYHDLIDFDPGPPPRLVNRERIETSGLELDWRHRWDASLSSRVQATAMNVRNPTSSEPLRHRPNAQLAASLDWDASAAWRWTVSAVYVGRRFDSSIPTGGVWLPAFTDLQLTATRTLGRWQFYGVIDNVRGTHADEVVGTPMGVRRVRVGVRVAL